MSNGIEMPIFCNDSDEPIIIRNRMLLMKSGFLNRAANAESKNWFTKPTKFSSSISVPYSKDVCEFVFKYAPKYGNPRLGSQEEKFVQYKAAMKKDLAQIREIMGCAVFLDCKTFSQAMGWVSARKLCKEEIEVIHNFLGEGGSEMAAEIDAEIERERRLAEYRRVIAKSTKNHNRNINQEADTNESTSGACLGEDRASSYNSFHDMICEFEAMFL